VNIRQPVRYGSAYVFGFPFVGKTKLAEAICPELGYVHLSSGELLRARRTVDPAFDKLMKEQGQDNGANVNFDQVREVLEAELKRLASEEPVLDRRRFLFDGVPRTMAQVDLMKRFILPLVGIGPEEKPGVVFLKLASELCIQRGLGRRAQAEAEGVHVRSDDREEVIKARVQRSRESVEDTLNYLIKSEYPVHVIDASKPFDQVLADVKIVLTNSGSAALQDPRSLDIRDLCA